MSRSDDAFPWAELLDIGVITGVFAALLYTAGWSYAYHYFQWFHLGLIGLEIEREYFLLYGFWVCKARLCLALLCLCAAFGLPLLFQRLWRQAAAAGDAAGARRLAQLRAVAQIGGPIGLLFLFIAVYQLGAGAGQADFEREQGEDFPSYPRVQVSLEKQDERGKDLAKVVPNSAVAAVRLLPSYQTPPVCQN